MAKPVDRFTFKQYCLRKLGWPAIKINVTDEQVEDRIDEAIAFWRDYHYDGSEKVYFKHQMTQVDLDNGYIAIPESFLGVTSVFDLSTGFQSSGMFSIQYQFMLNSISDITAGGLSNYVMTRQYLELLDEWLNGSPLIRFNRLTNKLYIDVTASKLAVGSYIIIEAYDGTSETTTEMWSDRWLQNYASALIKENWGNNVSKYQNPQLVSGIMFNGDKILDDAREERRKLEEEVIENFSPTLGFWMG